MRRLQAQNSVPHRPTKAPPNPPAKMPDHHHNHHHHLKTLTSSLLRLLLLLAAALLLLYILLFANPIVPSPTTALLAARLPLPPDATTALLAARLPLPPDATTAGHLLFGIASSAKSWPRRKDFLRLWWRPGLTRGLVFLDALPPPSSPSALDNRTLPPVRASADASRFPYAFEGGLPSAVRLARIVKELVDATVDDRGVRWVVLGDDDTVFFLENLVATLARYDWEQWYYIGGRSESVEQNGKNSFGMAFGGGGIAISYPLAKALARVLDSCLTRYGHLYGSDARVFACLAELGVELTHEPGFHQVDLRGDLFGMLSAHPLTPPVSLHHLEKMDPLFPGMNCSSALKHLFKAVDVDPGRILQQTICYDRLNSRTISVSWGYAVQVFEGNQLVTDLLSLQQTFSPWKRSRDLSSGRYMFNTREFPKDPCKRPAVFFLESVFSDKNRIKSTYSRYVSGNCNLSTTSSKNMQQIRVHSQQYNMEIGQVLRRHCCDVLPSSSKTVLEIDIRKCKDDELIAMHP